MTAEGKEPPAMSKVATDLYKSQGIGGFYRGTSQHFFFSILFAYTTMVHNNDRTYIYSLLL